MVKKGYERDIIRLDEEYTDVVCIIGNSWFYFGAATETENNTVEQYKASTPEEIIINEIFDTLESFKNLPQCKNEYTYYYEYLVENGIS